MLAVIFTSASNADLVSHWMAEGNAIDSAGSNHGTLRNGASFSSGVFGQSFQFDGINDYVEVPNNPSLAIRSSLTLAAWIRPLSQGAMDDTTAILWKGNNIATFSGQSYALMYSNGSLGSFAPNQGRLHFRVVQGSTFYQTPGIPIEMGEFSHIAATYDGTRMKIFVNGILTAFTATVPSLINVSSGDLLIGSSTKNGNAYFGDPTRFFFHGQIDDVRIYDHALTQEEIQRLVVPPVIIASHTVHNAWTGPGSPVDTQKVLAKEGLGPRLLSEANLINSSHGITGLGFDIQNLASSSGLAADDFIFQMSPQGSFSEILNPPANWAIAPLPSSVTTSILSEEDDLSRVSIEWPNNQIKNRWLRITVRANENTGLMQPQVYYIGHLRGETTGPEGSVYTVSFSDITLIRQAVGTQVDASSIFDIDKSGIVTFSDISAMRSQVGTLLTNITIPR